MHPTAKANPKSAVKMVDFPIAANQIISGKPSAKIWVSAQSPDLKVTQGIWDCTAGEFSWDYTADEFVMVLEGEARVAIEGGDDVNLGPGDFGYFPNGLRTKWTVSKYIKKTFVLRTPEPLKL